MKHFALHEWIDFARNSMAVDTKAEMQHHLNQGCTECQRAADLWKQVSASTAREGMYEPPQSALRAVFAHFALQRPAKGSAIERMKLAFDSLLHPLPAGIRSSGASARQLLFRSGNYSVDLRLEVQSESGHIFIVGQVLDSAKRKGGLASIPVALRSKSGAHQATITNDMGEFHFECPESESLQLSLALSSKRQLMLAIPLTHHSPSPEQLL
jgi:hypothetical protein